ncbi:MAG: hypothetical protein JST12_18500 [Armatimonadetes bacterium]|nr:hypothetical protein [Armatimonadota bacterium]
MPTVGSMTSGCSGGGGGCGGASGGNPTPASGLGQSDVCICPGGIAGYNVLPSPNSDDCIITSSGCLVASVEIRLADGSLKLAEDVSDGDVLLGRSDEGEVRKQVVSGVTVLEQPLVVIKTSRGEIHCSDSHPLFLDMGGTVLAPCLDPGDKLLTEDGSDVEVISVSPNGFGKVVGWQCLPDRNFFVDGVLHHNKWHIIAQPIPM